MGVCQGVNQVQETECEVTIEKKQGQLKSRHTQSMKTAPHKYPSINESIADEVSSKKTKTPIFVECKQINESMEIARSNRFIQDLESEVRQLIKQMQQLDEDSKREEENKTNDLKAKQIEQCFSFQNSLKRSETLHSNPYHPIQTSQFALKYEHKVIQEKQQIDDVSITPVSPKSVSPISPQNKKTNYQKTQTMKEGKSRQQADSFDKLMKDKDEKSSSRSKSGKTLKSILKKKNRRGSIVSAMSKSVKSTKTVRESKKVRFNKSTNFNNERKGQISKPHPFWEL